MIDKDKTHWMCRLFGHRAIPASWSMMAAGSPVQGFVLICTRCGCVLDAFPTKDTFAPPKADD